MARAVRDYDEQSVHTGWRRVLCWTQRAGACAYVKRRSNRRDRHQARRHTRATAHQHQAHTPARQGPRTAPTTPTGGTHPLTEGPAPHSHIQAQ